LAADRSPAKTYAARHFSGSGIWGATGAAQKRGVRGQFQFNTAVILVQWAVLGKKLTDGENCANF
jgi:hypothetical protein